MLRFRERPEFRGKNERVIRETSVNSAITENVRAVKNNFQDQDPDEIRGGISSNTSNFLTLMEEN